MTRGPWGKCPGLASSEESIPANAIVRIPFTERSSLWKGRREVGGELGAQPSNSPALLLQNNPPRLQYPETIVIPRLLLLDSQQYPGLS